MSVVILERPEINGRRIAPEFERSKIYLPAEKRVWTPRHWDGSVAVHAPLRPAIETVALEEKIRRAIEAEGGLKRGGLPRLLAGGAASAWAFTNTGRTSLLNGTFDIDSDSFKTALFLSTSDLGAAETTYAGVTNEHSNANGYTTGGIATTLTLSGTTTVTVDISSDPVWTASGGSITARFAAIYEVSGNVLVYCTLDSTPADVTATNGNTLTVAAHASGVFTLA